MMRRFLSCLLCLAAAVSLCACTAQQPTPQPEPLPQPEPAPVPVPEIIEPVEVVDPFVFTRENFPRLDGSTSTAPLAQAMCAVLLGEDIDAVTDLIRFSRTTQSYRNLMNGDADLLLAAEPAPEVLAELEAGGEWLLTPFATDALVFVVNQDNPVDGLTTDQLRKIYTGEITNWKEVGGSDMEIIPFQRNPEAGSQTMFEKLVMAGQPLMEAPTQWTSDSMSGLLSAVREYDNSPSAIGYTVYYYANDMEMARGLKVLSIDGVSPSVQAIRAGEYPFLNPYFVAIDKDAPEDSPTRVLYDWVLGPDGQKLAAQEGYVPVADVEYQTKDDTSTPNFDAGRWYPQTTTELITCTDYGPLYPYVGAVVQSVERWIDLNGVEQSQLSPWTTPVYGLMTREGKIVTDPSYQGIHQPVYRHGTQVIAHPVLLLSRACEEWNEYDTNGQRYAVCAKDGSWCTDFEFWLYTMNADALLLVGPGGVTLLDPLTGARQDWSWKHLNYTEEDLTNMLGILLWLYGFQWTDEGAILGLTNSEDWDNTDVRLFHPEDGTISVIPREEWESILDANLRTNWNNREEWEFTRDLEQITLSNGSESYSLPIPDGLNILHDVTVNGGLAVLQDYSGNGTCWLYRLSDATLRAQSSFITFLTDSHNPDAPAFIRIEQPSVSAALYTPDFTPFLSFDTAGAIFTYQDGLIFARDDTAFFSCYDAESKECIFYRNLNMGD